MAKVEWTEEAVQDVEKLDGRVAQRIVREVGWFGANFEKFIPEPLGGNYKGMYKLRIGDWRVIYSIEGDTITIRFVGHRSQICRI
ncbi:MAG: type II toxin-antitoxin system RelE/ParE family toxin [Chloroflexi bacterium]|nr:type II toxin-antitoxin system RelE/ParE family toxin [Chloroflexota bacterium]